MIKEMNYSCVFFYNCLDPLKNPFLWSLIDLDHSVDTLLLTSHQPSFSLIDNVWFSLFTINPVTLVIQQHSSLIRSYKGLIKVHFKSFSFFHLYQYVLNLSVSLDSFTSLRICKFVWNLSHRFKCVISFQHSHTHTCTQSHRQKKNDHANKLTSQIEKYEKNIEGLSNGFMEIEKTLGQREEILEQARV